VCAAWLLHVFLKAWELVALDNLNKIKVREAKSTTFTLYFDFLCDYPGQRPLPV
jgi:hypothetical protein